MVPTKCWLLLTVRNQHNVNFLEWGGNTLGVILCRLIVAKGKAHPEEGRLQSEGFPQISPKKV